MNCPGHNEDLNALLDGELPPPQAAMLATHLAGCPACARALAELAELRAGLAQMLPAEEAPPELTARIEELLTAEGKVVPFTPKRRLTRHLAWIAAPALAAALMLALLPGPDKTKDFLAVHDAALRSASLTTGAPAAAPVLAGFTLTGNHQDIVAGHVAQVVDYVREGQNFTLCIWPAGAEPAHKPRQAAYQGMAIKYWNDGEHEYWAVTAAPGGTLDQFVAAARLAS